MCKTNTFKFFTGGLFRHLIKEKKPRSYTLFKNTCFNIIDLIFYKCKINIETIVCFWIMLISNYFKVFR